MHFACRAFVYLWGALSVRSPVALLSCTIYNRAIVVILKIVRRSIMELESSANIDTALSRVAELLAFAGEHYAVAVLGGAALVLLGIVDRATSDVDILAFAKSDSPQPDLREPPEPFPEPLRRAIDTVARDMSLEERWMNAGPALQWKQGLPPGIAARVQWRHYGPAVLPELGLDIGLVSRYDLVFFKLYATVDHATTRSVHYKDLLALSPTHEELIAAASWVRQQNASPEFGEILDQVVSHVSSQLKQE